MALFESFLSSSIWRAMKWLPSIILRRFFSKQWLSDSIEIDVRPRHTDVEVLLPENPEATIYLSVQNNSHFKIELDRLLVDFCYTSFIADASDFRRRLLKPREKLDLILRTQIGFYGVKNLAFGQKHNPQHAQLFIMAELNSRLGNFRVERNLTGLNPRIPNAHLLENDST